MKQIFSLFVAGILGGIVTIGGVRLMDKGQEVAVEQPSFVRQVNYMNAGPASIAAPSSFTEAAAIAMPAVVHISASAGKTALKEEDSYNPFRFFFGDDFSNPFGGGAPQQGTGSGVIYSSDGYIITNNHVVEFAQTVEVTLYDNRKFTAQVIGTDKKSDLAVLKIDADGLPTLQAANSDNAKVGEWVLAVGNPFDLTSTVTAGIISAKGRSIQLLGGGDAIEAFIQTDAAVNPGNSGGALVDTQGKLLGINTAIATRTGVFQGYSFAIPVSLVTRIVDDIIEYGAFKRAFLGVNIYELNSEEAALLGIGISQGVVIDKLVDGGSAQYSGLLPKDVIIQVDGREIKTVPELQEVVGRAKVGDVINLKINRKGEIMTIPVKLKAG
jgi:serine protease Do